MSIPVAFKSFGVVFNLAAQTRRSPQFDRADKRPFSKPDLQAYWKLMAARPGGEAAALRLHLLTGDQRIEQFVRLKWADVSDDALTIFDDKGRPGQAPRAHQIPLVKLAQAELALLKREGEFAISTTAGKKAISVRTLAGWAHDVVGHNAALVQGLKLLTPSRVGSLLLGVVRGNADLHIAGCADLLARAAAVSAWRGQLQHASLAMLDAMPGDPSRRQAQADAWRRERAGAAVVHDTLRTLALAGHEDLAALADQAVTHWLAWPKTYGLDTVIVPALRLLAERPVLMDRPAIQRLRAAALAHLQTRVSLDLGRRPTGDATPG